MLLPIAIVPKAEILLPPPTTKDCAAALDTVLPVPITAEAYAATVFEVPAAKLKLPATKLSPPAALLMSPAAVFQEPSADARTPVTKFLSPVENAASFLPGSGT